MARLPDLVQDSKLETRFLRAETLHIYNEPDPSSLKRLSSRLEYWERQEKIGGGSFGSVWLEKCTKGGRDIKVRAVKQLEINSPSTHMDYSRELEAVAKFSHWRYERCFVKSFGWYESPECLYIALEYLNLGDLRTYLRRKPPIPEDEVKQIAGQILDGLCMMHDNQFAHRDLKPNNILLKSCPPDEWWVKIADFGISKRIDKDIAKPTTLQGTLGYIAPEIHGFIKGGSPYAVDIWAAGEIMFEMLTKQPTFKYLGLLSKYTKKPETFPSDVLLAAQVSRLGIEFILSHMQPMPVDRITAENALRHQWLTQSLPSRRVSTTSTAYKEAYNPSTIASTTETFASWNTVPSQRAATVLIPRIKKKFEIVPRQTSSKDLVSIPALDGTLVTRHTLEGHSDWVGAVAFSPDSKLVASASSDRTIRLWDATTGAACHTLRGHSDWVWAVAFSPSGKLASASHDGTVRLWDTATGAEYRTLRGHSAWIWAVEFSPDGELVASASSDRTVRLWDAATGAVRYTLKGHSNQVAAVAFSPDGKLVASISSNRNVRLWDTATGELYHTLEGQFDWVEAVSFSPNGRLIASASYNSTVQLWDTATGAVHHMLKGHSSRVRAVAFFPNGKLIASASSDRTVRLWDADTGAVRYTLKGHSDQVGAVAFSPDGKLMASASHDRTVRLWCKTVYEPFTNRPNP